jgi:hypothetical protein
VLDANTNLPCPGARRHMNGNPLRVFHKPRATHGAGGRTPVYGRARHVLDVSRLNQIVFVYGSLLRRDNQAIEKMADPYFGLEPGLMTLLAWEEAETWLCCVRVRPWPMLSRWSQQADLKSGVNPR